MDALVTCLCILLTLHPSMASVVDTQAGQIQGLELQESGVEMFLGIPYAEAPIGPLRFKPPVRKSRMDGVYSAFANNKICPQIQFFPDDSVNITEDCLRLDIYKPLSSNRNSQLPVMIWVYGGGYYFGNTREYTGFGLVQYDVIFVAVNYRLGVLGFLNTLDDFSVGNFGLRDQCSAIEWVTENIEEFGGNPNQITIFGESAGSTSVMQLALSNLCHGKFQRVIAQSGSPLDFWSYNNNAKENVEKLAHRSGCPQNSELLVSCLREKSVDDILGYQPYALFQELEWVPTYSPDIFPENPLDLVKKGESGVFDHFRSLDILVGIMAEEVEFEFVATRNTGFFSSGTNLTMFELGDEEFSNMLHNGVQLYTKRSAQDIARLLPAVKFMYTDWNNPDDRFANTRMFIRAFGDISYMIGSVRTSLFHSMGSSTGNTYFYKFNRKPSWADRYPWTEGATHTEEIAFVFGYTGAAGGSAAEMDLSKAVMEYWTNFAKTGNPNQPENQYVNTTWPTFNGDTAEFIELDIEMTADSVSQYPYAERFAFWQELFPTLEKDVDDYNNMVDRLEQCIPTDFISAGHTAKHIKLCLVVALLYFINHLYIHFL